MDWKRRLAVLVGALLILTGIWTGRSQAQSEWVGGPIPTPSAVVQFLVSARQVYPFPWSGVEACLRPFQPGCFVVREISLERIVLAYARFEIDGGTLKPQGFRYLTPVTPGGSGYELFTIKLGGGREEWVYAVLERVEAETARIQFLKLPAFVTERARITVGVTVALAKRRLEEVYEVDAEDSITLLGFGNLGALFPSARIDRIEVNGQPVGVRYRDILHLNLPAGRHRVRVEVDLGRLPPQLTLQGTLLEPRKMFLIRELALRVDLGSASSGSGVEVRTVGLPPEVWERFRSTLTVAPVPVGEEPRHLAIRYRFGPSREVTLRTRPRIPLGPNNYPVMITIAAPGPE